MRGEYAAGDKGKSVKGLIQKMGEGKKAGMSQRTPNYCCQLMEPPTAVLLGASASYSANHLGMMPLC